MNLIHRWLCRSDYWKKTVETQLLPWALEGVELGSNVLEIGPGPGITTDFLRTRVARLTCVEVDSALADSLAHRMAGKNVRVLCEDATAMALAGETFDGVVSFTMLHHVPSAALQDRVLEEAARVLRPGGTFAGVDSLNRRFFSTLHLFDTLVLVDPRTFPSRLQAAGFADIHVDVGPRSFRFRARKPD